MHECVGLGVYVEKLVALNSLNEEEIIKKKKQVCL